MVLLADLILADVVAGAGGLAAAALLLLFEELDVGYLSWSESVRQTFSVGVTQIVSSFCSTL